MWAWLSGLVLALVLAQVSERLWGRVSAQVSVRRCTGGSHCIAPIAWRSQWCSTRDRARRQGCGSSCRRGYGCRANGGDRNCTRVFMACLANLVLDARENKTRELQKPTGKC